MQSRTGFFDISRASRGCFGHSVGGQDRVERGCAISSKGCSRHGSRQPDEFEAVKAMAARPDRAGKSDYRVADLESRLAALSAGQARDAPMVKAARQRGLVFFDGAIKYAKY